jgi:hypothetical protein
LVLQKGAEFSQNDGKVNGQREGPNTRGAT